MELDLPRPVAEMCADLAGQGFDVVDERRGGSGRPDAGLDLAAATRFVRDRLPEAARVISSTPLAERALARLDGDRSG